MKMPRRPKEVTEKIEKIVNYYMNFVVGHDHEFSEMIEYYWRCMSAGSVDDYEEIADKAGKIDLLEEIKTMRQEVLEMRAEMEKMYEANNEHR